MRKFLKSAFFISAGGALPLLSGLVLLIPYTLNLSTSNYGELAIFISFSFLVQYLMNYGIDTFMTVHYYDHSHDNSVLKKFKSGIFGVVIFIGLTFTILFSITGPILFDFLFKDENISFFPFGFLSVITAFFNGFFRTYVNLQILERKEFKYFLFGVFNFTVTVLLSTILVIKFPGTIVGPMYGRLLSGVLIFIISLIFIMRDVHISFSRTLFKKIIQYCKPIIIFNILTWVLVYFNNFILNAFESTSSVGVYDFALKCILLIEYSGIGLLSTINPRVMQIYKNDNLAKSSQEENKYYHVFNLFNLSFIAINIILLPILIKLFVSNSQYYASFVLLPLMCISFAFRGLYNAFWNPIIYFKRTLVLPRALVITALIQVISAIFLTQEFGIIGAVWSYFLAKPVQVFVMWYLSRRSFVYRFNKLKMVFIPIIYCLIVIFVWQFVNLSYFYKSLIQLGSVIILIMIAYKREIKEIPALWNKIL